MNKKRAFISFDYENDHGLSVLLGGQAKLPDSPFEFQNWSVKKPFPESTWRSDVRTRIRSCDVVIVIIGAQTYRADGVIEEIKIANEEGIPCVGVYKEGVSYYVPSGLSLYAAWTWENLKKIINQV